MLAMASKRGVVSASLPGMADVARFSLDEAVDARARLSAPDPFSRSKTDEGRRIHEIDGGWQIINHTHYRELRDEDQERIDAAERQRKHRALSREVTKVTAVTPPAPAPAPSPENRCPPAGADALRLECKSLILEASEATGFPPDVVLARASRTRNGRLITSIDSCTSAEWLRVTRDRLLELRLQGESDRQSQPSRARAREPAPEAYDAETVAKLKAEAAERLEEIRRRT